MMDECDSFIKKRQDCYNKHYNGIGIIVDDDNNSSNDNNIIPERSMNNKLKKCWIPILKVKRCQAFQLCKREAFEYYKSPSDLIVGNNGTTNSPKDKGICSAYDEAYCFGNPQIMKIDLDVSTVSSNNPKKTLILERQKQRQDIFDHHEKAKRKVLNSKKKQGQCNDIRKKLNNCLRSSTSTTSQQQ